MVAQRRCEDVRNAKENDRWRNQEGPDEVMKYSGLHFDGIKGPLHFTWDRNPRACHYRAQGLKGGGWGDASNPR